jgi:hypothetical protein
MVEFHEEVTVLRLAFSIDEGTAPILAVIVQALLMVAFTHLRMFGRGDSCCSQLFKHLHQFQLVIVQVLKRPFESEKLALASTLKLHCQRKLDRLTGVLSTSRELVLP